MYYSLIFCVIFSGVCKSGSDIAFAIDSSYSYGSGFINDLLNLVERFNLDSITPPNCGCQGKSNKTRVAFMNCNYWSCNVVRHLNNFTLPLRSASFGSQKLSKAVE